MFVRNWRQLVSAGGWWAASRDFVVVGVVFVLLRFFIRGRSGVQVTIDTAISKKVVPIFCDAVKTIDLNSLVTKFHLVNRPLDHGS